MRRKEQHDVFKFICKRTVFVFVLKKYNHLTMTFTIKLLFALICFYMHSSEISKFKIHIIRYVYIFLYMYGEDGCHNGKNNRIFNKTYTKTDKNILNVMLYDYIRIR